MKKILLLFGFLSLTLSSCSDSDSPIDESIPEDKSILPKMISYAFPDFPEDNSSSVINYNGNKIVNTIDTDSYGKSKTVFTYEGNVIAKQAVFKIDSEGREDKSKEVLYTYENGKLKTRTLSRGFTVDYPDGQSINKTVYAHNSNGVITSVSFSIDPKTKVEKIEYNEILTYSNRNLIKEEITYENSHSITKLVRAYAYDTKNNPYKNILGFDLLLNEISDFGTNNSIKTTRTFDDSDAVVFKATYIYNEKGYPNKQTSYTGGEASQSIEYEINYTY